MVNYARVATHIDRGNGKAAQKLGQPYLSYRVESGSAGDFPAGWGLLPTIPANYPIFKRKLASETKAEIAVKNAAQWFELIGDMTPFLLGDIFVQNDPAYNPGVSYGAGATLLSDTLQFNAICFAWHDPVKRRLGARLDRLAGIYRPAASPKTLPDDSLYWTSTNENDQPLVLAGGTFAFGAAGAGGASMVPVGMMSQHRNSEAIFEPSVPGVSSLKPARWMAYIPPLPGYEPTEGDAILTQDGARYVISSPYTQEAGVVGSQCLVERKISQAA